MFNAICIKLDRNSSISQYFVEILQNFYLIDEINDDIKAEKTWKLLVHATNRIINDLNSSKQIQTEHVNETNKTDKASILPPPPPPPFSQVPLKGLSTVPTSVPPPPPPPPTLFQNFLPNHMKNDSSIPQPPPINTNIDFQEKFPVAPPPPTIPPLYQNISKDSNNNSINSTLVVNPILEFIPRANKNLKSLNWDILPDNAISKLFYQN